MNELVGNVQRGLLLVASLIESPESWFMNRVTGYELMWLHGSSRRVMCDVLMRIMFGDAKGRCVVSRFNRRNMSQWSISGEISGSQASNV